MEHSNTGDTDSDSEFEETRLQLETYAHVVHGVNPLRGRELDESERLLEAAREATREALLQLKREAQNLPRFSDQVAADIDELLRRVLEEANTGHPNAKA